MSALQMRVVDLNSKASAAPTQVWCLEGVEKGFWWVMVNKKPESEDKHSSFKGPKSFWRLMGAG